MDLMPAQAMELFWQTAPLYESFLSEQLGRNFFLKPPILTPGQDKLLLHFVSELAPENGLLFSEVIDLHVEFNRAMKQFTTRVEYWSDPSDLNPKVKTQPVILESMLDLTDASKVFGQLLAFMGAGKSTCLTCRPVEASDPRALTIMVEDVTVLLYDKGIELEEDLSMEEWLRTVRHLAEYNEGVLTVQEANFLMNLVKGAASAIGGISGAWKAHKANFKDKRRAFQQSIRQAQADVKDSYTKGRHDAFSNRRSTDRQDREPLKRDAKKEAPKAQEPAKTRASSYSDTRKSLQRVTGKDAAKKDDAIPVADVDIVGSEDSPKSAANAPAKACGPGYHVSPTSGKCVRMVPKGTKVAKALAKEIELGKMAQSVDDIKAARKAVKPPPAPAAEPPPLPRNLNPGQYLKRFGKCPAGYHQDQLGKSCLKIAESRFNRHALISILEGVP